MTVADVRVALVDYLAADAAIAAMVEWSVPRNSGGKRIFPNQIKQGVTKDSIVYNRVSGLGDHHMQGPSGLNRPRIQITCWSLSADNATRLADLVKARLDGFRGLVEWDDDSPANAISVRGIFYQDERDLFDDESDLFGVARDYMVWMSER